MCLVRGVCAVKKAAVQKGLGCHQAEFETELGGRVSSHLHLLWEIHQESLLAVENIESNHATHSDLLTSCPSPTVNEVARSVGSEQAAGMSNHQGHRGVLESLLYF